jgi:hypothetical protein
MSFLRFSQIYGNKESSMSKEKVVFDYFHGYESEQFAFYRIPKVLFTDDYFRKLSSDAKILYGLMLDRMALSIKNNWIDDKDRVYIIFTLEQVMEYMNCGKDKGVKILAELDTNKGIGLIERVKRGLGKPAIIYVKSFIIKREIRETKKVQSRSSEVGNIEVKTSEKPKSRVLLNRSTEVGKSDTINTDNNNTDFSNNNLINLSDTQKEEKMDVMEAYRDIIKENIEYNHLILTCDFGDKECIDEIVDLMAETVSVEREQIHIAGSEYPYQLVKNKLLKLDYSHVQYVLECLRKNTTKIHNVKAYLLACLFNASSTINNYYRAEVNHDMYGDL